MNEIFLMNALESFHDFQDDPDCLSKRKDLSWKFCLISEEIALFAVLHDDDDEFAG